jgi:S1-C subfamily serine protease
VSVSATLLAGGVLLATVMPARADYAAGAAHYARGDYERAFLEMVPAAADGNADAQFTVAVMHDVGQHVAIDKKEAAEWYRRAANQGHPNAQLRLAGMLFDGDGIKRNRREAYVWALLSAERLPTAQQRNAQDYAERVLKTLGDGDARRARAVAASWQPRLPYVLRRADGAPPRRSAVGTGVFLNRDGALLTNLHVVFPCTQLLVSRGDEAEEAKVRNFDVALDLALLSTPYRPEDAASFAVMPALAVGERIGFTGYAPRETRSRASLSTHGAVIALSDTTGSEDFFRTSAAVFAGQSGGPVTREGGAVVGLIKGTGRVESFSLAIAGQRIVAFLERAKVAYRQGTAGPPPATTIARVECWR